MTVLSIQTESDTHEQIIVLTKNHNKSNKKMKEYCLNLLRLVFIITTLNQVTFVHNFMEEHSHRITYLEGRVGEHAVFNCHIDFPQDIQIPYILHWIKDVIQI